MPMDEPMLEIRVLRYVLAVARHGSFSRAAEALNLAQPSLSQQIAKLESELGAQLFVRSARGVVPTELGAMLIERAQALMVNHDDLIRELSDRHADRPVVLTVGAPSITGGHLLPPLLAQYRHRFPHVRVQLIEESPERLEELTANGLTDLSVLALPIRHAHLDSYPILTEALVLALPRRWAQWMPESWQSRYRDPNHRWWRTPVSFSTMAVAPFILLKPGYGFRQTVLELCAESGFQPQIAFETANIDTAQALAAYGHGVTLVPEMVMTTAGAVMPRYLQVAEQPSRTLVFARRKDRYLSQAASQLIALAANPKDEN